MSLGAVIGHAKGARGDYRPLAGVLTKGLHDLIRAVDRKDFTALLDTPGIDLRVYVVARFDTRKHRGGLRAAGTAWASTRRVERFERGGKRIALSIHIYDDAFDNSDAWLLEVLIHELRHAVDNVEWALFLRKMQQEKDRANAEDRDVDEDSPFGFREFLRRLAYMKGQKTERNADAAANRALMKLTAREVYELAQPFRAVREALAYRR